MFKKISTFLFKRCKLVIGMIFFVEEMLVLVISYTIDQSSPISARLYLINSLFLSNQISDGVQGQNLCHD